MEEELIKTTEDTKEEPVIKDKGTRGRWSSLLLALLSLIGVADTLYLALSHLNSSPVVCSIFNECDLVLTSKYATLFSIPLALIGFLYYLTLFTLTFLSIRTKDILFLKLTAAIAGLGVLVSFWLLYLQAEVIKAYCLYCLISLVLTLIIALTSFIQLRKAGK